MQTHQLNARITRMLTEMKRLTRRAVTPIADVMISPRGENRPVPFENGGAWAVDSEWWDFTCAAVVPEGYRGRVVLRARTGREEEWEATNPQLLARVNGRIEQAFDTRHTTLLLQEAAEPGTRFDILLNAYSALPGPGQIPPVLELTVEDIHEPLAQLCYDIEVPLEAALLLKPGEREREAALETLARALDLLDLRKP